MKKTTESNIIISKIIEKKLGITFSNEEFSLNGWGEVDNYCKYNEDTIIFLECEKGQKHPNTNVVKLFPFIEENDHLKIILIHYFFSQTSKISKNRIKLCDFFGNKMEQIFEDRFVYLKIMGEESDIQAYSFERIIRVLNIT